METVDIALKYGWRSIKLYFMLGLPTETDEDIDGIIQLTRSVLERSRKQLSVNITLSTFIPKPFTPFQWEAQNSPLEIQRKLNLIKTGLRQYKRVKIMTRDPEYSQIEGIIARGDRAVAKVIYDAWCGGAKFDSWREQFKQGIWDQAFEKHALDIQKYIGHRDIGLRLPWEHINPLVSREFLLKEREKAYGGQITVDCRECCIACGVCDPGSLFMDLVDEKGVVFAEPVEIHNPDPVGRFRYRLRYMRQGSARFISHLDSIHVFQQALRRAKLKLSYTQGFNRRPRISAGHPLPFGYSSQDEYLDVFLSAEANEIVERLNDELPVGIHIESAELVPLKSPSLFAQVNGFDYEIREAGELPPDFDERVETLLARKELSIVRSRKGWAKSVNIRAFISDIKRATANTFQLSVAVIGGQTARPDEVLSCLNMDGISSICRSKTYFKPTL
jgi:radical SAM-linked protein